jgi:hypothetical protein
MNCPQEAQALLPMMAATRGGFERLEQDLVQSMVMQAVTGVTAGLASQAQHLIDTLVRNLYERTADVGFLATDAMLCQFMAAADGDEAAITQRLRAYRSKYTVYADILLLDAEGQVRASARERSQATDQPCRDALIARALQSQGFVQSFGATDLLPGHGSALIYAHRMLHAGNRQPLACCACALTLMARCKASGADATRLTAVAHQRRRPASPCCSMIRDWCWPAAIRTGLAWVRSAASP